MHYTLLVGVHGVGKTTLLSKIREDIGLTALSISDLIRQTGNNIQSDEKNTKNIKDNQDLWKIQLKKYSFNSDELVVLDGHFALLDSQGKVIELPFSTFDDISIDRIVLKSESASIIKKRLEDRDGKIWDEELISHFQDSERKRAHDFSKHKGIPIFEFQNDSQMDELLNFLN